ncbi:MAG: glycosyltransferase [Acidimicrobiales bacterium]
MPESYGFLSTYPPTQCGLATFTASLISALGDGPQPCAVGVVRVLDGRGDDSGPEVVHQMEKFGLGSQAAADSLNQFDVVVVQHEYGIYGGLDGDSVLAVARRVRSPMIVVLHTVLASPTAHQRSVLEQLGELAQAVVVMTETARRWLAERYDVDPTKVELIAHGAPTDWGAGGRPTAASTPLMLTWGLLGPGKGIEWAVDALAKLQDLRPAPRYVVAGETHPHVAEREGEAYRIGLADRAQRLGVGHALGFVDRYLGRAELRALVQAADVIVLPYDSTDQVTSGVLIEAVTARRPVVATAFPHAVEMLSSGAGIIVGQGDAQAMADAVRTILTQPERGASMVAAAERLAPELTWAAVAERYRLVGDRLRSRVAVVGA